MSQKVCLGQEGHVVVRDDTGPPRGPVLGHLGAPALRADLGREPSRHDVRDDGVVLVVLRVQPERVHNPLPESGLGACHTRKGLRLPAVLLPHLCGHAVGHLLRLEQVFEVGAHQLKEVRHFSIGERGAEVVGADGGAGLRAADSRPVPGRHVGDEEDDEEHLERGPDPPGGNKRWARGKQA